MIKELAHYFINQGIHVVALTPKKKYPNYKGWQTKRLTIEQVDRALNNGYGLGIVPHGEFVAFFTFGKYSEDNRTKEYSDGMKSCILRKIRAFTSLVHIIALLWSFVILPYSFMIKRPVRLDLII